MKRILAATATVLLLATAAVNAGPLSGALGAKYTTDQLETAQFKKKGKGFKKKGAKGGKGGKCWARCIAKVALVNACQTTCASKGKR